VHPKPLASGGLLLSHCTKKQQGGAVQGTPLRATVPSAESSTSKAAADTQLALPRPAVQLVPVAKKRFKRWALGLASVMLSTPLGRLQEVRELPPAGRLRFADTRLHDASNPGVRVGVGVGLGEAVAEGAVCVAVRGKEVEGVLEGVARKVRVAVGVGEKVGVTEALASALAVEVGDGGGVPLEEGPTKVLSSLSPAQVAASLRGLHRMMLQQGCALQGI